MGLPIDSLIVYKYKIDRIILHSPSWESAKSIEGTYISSLTINNDYDDAIAPQMIASIQAEYNTYYEILAAAKTLTAKFTISIASTGSNKNDTNTDSQNIQYTTEWISIDMKATDQGYLISRDIAENSNDKSTTDQTTNESLKNTRLPINLYLYDANKLINYRKNKSFIINGNKNDVIYEFFNKRTIDNILVSASEDDKIGTYAIPLGDLGQNLKDLNEYYGIYDYNYLFYMGLDRTYLFNKGNIGVDLEQNELASVNIYIESYDESDSSNIYNGCYRDEANNVYVIGASEISIDNVDTLIDFSNGSDIITAVASTGKNYKDTIGEYAVEKSFLINNPLQRTQLIHALKEGKRRLYITVNNIDVSIITPNKKYTIIANSNYYSTDYEISGTYRLTAANIIFTSVGNNTFETSTSLTLAKVEE